MGSARLFGIQLTENFDHPYAATSVVDFWHRWHISLTGWLRKYVYFPLGGSRVSTPRRYLNVMITFFVSGLWHGASLTYVVWGLLHGLCQVIEIQFKKFFPPKAKPGKGSLAFGRIRTLVLVAVGWVFFRADTLGNAFLVLGGLFNRWVAPGKAFAALGMSVGAWIIFLLAAFSANKLKDLAASKRTSAWIKMLCCSVLTVLVLLAVVFNAGSGAENSFIYFNF